MLGGRDYEIQQLLRDQFPRQDVAVQAYAGAAPAFWMWDADKHVPTSIIALYRMVGKDALAYHRSLPIVQPARSSNGELELLHVGTGRK